ncbi:MAG: hypothetical protein M3Z06_15310, partial [Actinomycetota bacterium]|nr:hypothetical protein [Actinomycetota bacterium]
VRWSASDIEVHIDLDGTGNEAGPHNWTADKIATAIKAIETASATGLHHRPSDPALAMDGDGVKRPMPVEIPDVAWRADPSDGLRPLLATRERLLAMH